ncbi:MAG: hypothetical protein JNM74_19655 [Myxococcales bacterium]|nr:hypothetical protein [Myxococcales bacterium]
MAQLRIARIQNEHLHDYEAADEAYHEFLDVFPLSIHRDDALFENGVMWIEHEDVPRGCALLERVVTEFDGTRARRAALARMQTDCPEEYADVVEEGDRQTPRPPTPAAAPTPAASPTPAAAPAPAPAPTN